MIEFKNSNDYRVWIFFPKVDVKNGVFNEIHPKVYHCTDIYNFYKWVSTKYQNFIYLNVYAKRTNRFLLRIYPKSDYVPNKPK